MKKILIISVILIIIILGYYLIRPQSIPVLCYHDIMPESKMNHSDKQNGYIVSVEDFEEQMKYISKKGYKTLTMDQFYCWMDKKCKFPRKTVLITFDDGNKSIYEYVLPILKKYNLKASSFIISSRIYFDNNVLDNYNFLTKDMIDNSKVRYSGLEFHSHTYDMHKTINGKRAVDVYNNKQLNEDISKVSEYLNTQYIAYPFGSYNEKFIKVLKNRNYKMAFLYEIPFIRATQSNDLYKIPRISIQGNLSFWRFKLALSIGLPSKR